MFEITGYEFIFLLPSIALGMFYTYWKGYNKGRREGYISGRSLTRVPVRNER